jgi:hypothetical protein
VIPEVGESANKRSSGIVALASSQSDIGRDADATSPYRRFSLSPFRSFVFIRG